MNAGPMWYTPSFAPVWCLGTRLCLAPTPLIGVQGEQPRLMSHTVSFLSCHRSCQAPLAVLPISTWLPVHEPPVLTAKDVLSSVHLEALAFAPSWS